MKTNQAISNTCIINNRFVEIYKARKCKIS